MQGEIWVLSSQSDPESEGVSGERRKAGSESQAGEKKEPDMEAASSQTEADEVDQGPEDVREGALEPKVVVERAELRRGGRAGADVGAGEVMFRSV